MSVWCHMYGPDRGNLFIIDDPLKPGDAVSEVSRERVIEWYLCVPKSKSERIDDEVRPVWRANL